MAVEGDCEMMKPRQVQGTAERGTGGSDASAQHRRRLERFAGVRKFRHV